MGLCDHRSSSTARVETSSKNRVFHVPTAHGHRKSTACMFVCIMYVLQTGYRQFGDSSWKKGMLDGSRVFSQATQNQCPHQIQLPHFIPYTNTSPRTIHQLHFQKRSTYYCISVVSFLDLSKFSVAGGSVSAPTGRKASIGCRDGSLGNASVSPTLKGGLMHAYNEHTCFSAIAGNGMSRKWIPDSWNRLSRLVQVCCCER